jgi:D-cysteine desulfhydrase
MSSFGSYPTPVRYLERLSTAKTALWVKHDDQTNAIYGGNKVRKIARLLEDAKQRGKRTVVTMGAVGSHHVLTTGIFARALGMHTEAVIIAQPSTPHVLEIARADLGQGVKLFPASSIAHAGLQLAARVLRGAHYIPAGGSNAIGARGFVDAAGELASQVRAGELPEPDLLVVALGSGGTTAGLLAGLAQEGLRTRVLAVTVAAPAWFIEHRTRSLAKRLTPKALHARALDRLQVDHDYLGDGYGHRTALGDQATAQAAEEGITLDATYTAKAFAAALARVAAGSERTILYWHTLSSAPMAPLLNGAPSLAEVDERIRRLAR